MDDNDTNNTTPASSITIQVKQAFSDFTLLDNFSVEELISVLEELDDLYFNDDGQSAFADKEYDILRKYAMKRAPYHEYFTGAGSTVRTGKTDLPYPMPGLSEVAEYDTIEWVKRWNMESENFLISEKLDGISALVIYSPEGKLQIAYSRGDTKQGADITRHISSISNLPTNINSSLVIRGEVIIAQPSFEILKDKIKTRSGQKYKNPRNMVAGLMNAKENDPIVYKYIDFVVYDLIHGLDCDVTVPKDKRIEKLKYLDFNVPFYTLIEGEHLDDTVLSNILENRKLKSPYQIDGIVVEVNDYSIRNKMSKGKDAYDTPKHTVKYKIRAKDIVNYEDTEVEEVIWTLSMHGYYKPRVKIKPVEMDGVTITYTTGFNAKYIKDNKIGPGAVVRITRSGDVIPYIKTVVSGTTAQMPKGDWEWNNTNVDAVVEYLNDYEDVIKKQMLEFFSGINTPLLKEGAIEKFYDRFKPINAASGITEVLNLSEQEMESILNTKNAAIIHENLCRIKMSAPAHEVLGSLPFFGRGVGKRVFKKLITQKRIGSLKDLHSLDVYDIIELDSFDKKTAIKIVDGLAQLDNFLDQAEITLSFPDPNDYDDKLEGMYVVFTGFRDKALQAQLESQGAKVQSSVNGKSTVVVASDPDSKSSKVKKAKDLGLQVLTKDQFLNDFLKGEINE